jgi:hypothetical protein
MTAFDVMGGALIFMMCCWQIPKLFAAVIGGSPALTGGDLIATTAVLGSAAFAAGSAAVSGVTALASVGGAAAVGGGSASSGGTGSVTRSAIASVGPHGAGSSAAGSSVSPPSSASPGGSPARRQPDPPLSSSSRSISSTLPSVGGEPLAGSGFEGQAAQRGFTPMSVTGTHEGPTSEANWLPPSTETSSTNLGSQSSSGRVPNVTSIGSVGSANPLSPPPRRGTLTRAVDQVLRGMRLRFLSLPSDAAPHNTPPRIPIDHEENP